MDTYSSRMQSHLESEILYITVLNVKALTSEGIYQGNYITTNYRF